jgi:hypothetical protein
MTDDTLLEYRITKQQDKFIAVDFEDRVQAEDPQMAGTLRGYLGLLGIGVHALSGLFALELAVNFAWSLFKGDLSPWWFWPARVAAVLVLMLIAGNLLRLLDKDD